MSLEREPFVLAKEQFVESVTCEVCRCDMGVLNHADPRLEPAATFCPPCGGGCTCVWYKPNELTGKL